MAGKKGRSGRKPRSVHRMAALTILIETSPHAAQHLRDVAKGLLGTYTETTTRKNGDVVTQTLPIPADPVRVDVCKYVINQDLGMPRQKIEFDYTKEATRLALEMGLPETEIPRILAEAQKVIEGC